MQRVERRRVRNWALNVYTCKAAVFVELERLVYAVSDVVDTILKS